MLYQYLNSVGFLMFILFTTILYSLSHEYHYCTALREPTTGYKTSALVRLVFHSDMQLGLKHSCGNLQGFATCGTNPMLHSELHLDRLSMQMSHETTRMSHCKWAAQQDMTFRTLSAPLKLPTTI